MNKNLLFLIGGLVVAGAVGAYFFLNKPALPGNPLTGGNQSMPTTFAQLMAMGQDYTCTFANTDDTGNTSSGTVFVADQGKKLNGEFMMTLQDGTETQSYVISDGEYNYIWGPTMAQGFKTKVDPEASVFTQPEGEDDGTQIGLDENEAMDFQCQPWRPDNSKFVPPSNIEFVDFSAQVEMMQEYTAPTVDDQTGDNLKCGYCAALEGETKAQCLTAMGC